jgi:hypothetical protein
MDNLNPERELVEQALEALALLGLRSHVVEAQGLEDKSRPNAIIEIGRDDGDVTRGMVRYAVEVKRQVTSSNLGPVVHELLGRDDKPILATRYVSPPIADDLRKLGIQFIDTAGNAWLSNRDFMVWAKGERPRARHLAQTNERLMGSDSGRAFQPRGLQVVFTLLCDPAWINKSFRELAHMSTVAHGTVQSVIADLEEEGFVRTLGNNSRGTRRMFNLDELLRKWTDAYARTLRPRTLMARYYAPNDAQWRAWDLGAEARWGGEPAGALLTQHLKPEDLTIYAGLAPPRLVVRQQLRKSAEPGHTRPVDFRRRFWDFSLEAAAAPHEAALRDAAPHDAGLRETSPPYATPHDAALDATVPPLLIYADLIATGDARCLEAANLIHEAHLARSLGQ